MMSTSRSLRQRLRQWMGAAPPARSQSTRAVQEEILHLCSRTLSLDELLRLIPERLRAALELSSFQVFLRAENAYVLRAGADGEARQVSFPGSSSTVLRMRRSRRPARFVQESSPRAEPDAWQLLAEPLELEALGALGAELLLPLDGRTGLVGFATMGRLGNRPFSASELEFLRELGPQMGRGLETAQLVSTISQQAVERARVHRELELAREVQERLLPKALPAVAGVAAAAAYRSAEQVGGDYYDLFATRYGSLCMVVADVSGKGVAAALLMAALRATLHALMSESAVSIAKVVERLNSLLYSASLDNRYATLFLSTYDSRDCSLTYVNAGHNPPILLRRSGRTERLTRGGTVVGLLPYAEFETETLSLEPGDALFAYTDGVTEANNPKGLEWGEAALEQAILHLARPLDRASNFGVNAILGELDGFVAGAPQNDDITLLALHRNEV